MKHMKSLILTIMTVVMLTTSHFVRAQMKITDGENQVIDGNAILDLESDSLGFLPPRVAIDDPNSAVPLAGPVTEGMTVYSTGGIVPDGYYCWDGSRWQRLLDETYSITTVTKQVSDTLLKSEKVVLAENDITLTLPAINSEDNGLTITVKNTGTYTDMVFVKGYDGATIDGTTESWLSRWRSETYTAHEGNWIIREKLPRINKRLDVCPKSSWTTLQEVVAFLNEHMMAPMVVQLCGGSYEITETIEIDLPYPLTIMGLSFGETYLEAGEGLTGQPMFRCKSECYFKMLVFDGSTLENYGGGAKEDAIHLTGEGVYYEVKNAYFLNFNKAIVDSASTEVWILDTDFEDIFSTAIDMTGGGTGPVFKISESDFINCSRGIGMNNAAEAIISIINCGFYGAQSTDTAIIYRPSTFNFTTIAISNNTWNNTGEFIEGFDFSRPDGRDADAEIMNNIGIENKIPHCKINVVNNNSNIYCQYSNSWYKLPWTNTSYYTCKWTIDNNRITYQPNYIRDVIVYISGNIQVNSSNRVLTVGIVKNGQTGIRYGETSLRITTANQPFQFSTVIYLEEVDAGDYFELYVSSLNSSDYVRVQDINWFVNTQ